MRVQAACAAAVAATFAIGFTACGGGGSGAPLAPSPGPSQPGQAAATITITADGVNPRTVRIQPGQSVRFVNNDSQTHVPSSDPHPTHSDCPGINSAGTLAPGASRDTSALSAARSCGFHDHNNPDEARFRGQIVVGDGPEMPGY